jgi:hypothetical protein
MSRLTYVLQSGTCFAAFLFVFASWSVLLRSRAVTMPAPARFLLALTLVWVHVIACVLLLGLFGSVTRTNVVFLPLGVAAVVLAIALYTTAQRRDAAADVESGDSRQRDVLIAGVVLIAALAFAWQVMLAVFFPPVGYDDLAYRLPGSAFVLQSGSLRTVDLPARLEFVNFYPQATEFLSIWCFALLGTDAMVGLWQSGIYVHFVLASVVLCRACGCGRNSTRFAVGLAALTPTVLGQILTTYNDLFIAALFASALAFAVLSGRDDNRWCLLGLSLSCGCLLAAKLSSPLLVGIAVLIYLAQAILSGRRAVQLARGLLLILMPAMALGGYWYVRNAVLFGNPVYPFQVDIAGLHLPGRFSASVWSANLLNPELSKLPLFERLWKLWLEQKSHYGLWFYSYSSAFGGFGPAWFILGLPSIAAALVTAAFRRAWSVLTVLAVTVTLYLSFSGNISVRYTLFVLPTMALAIAIVVDELRRSADAADRSAALVARLSLGVVRVVGLGLAVVIAGLMTFAMKSPQAIARQIVTGTVAKVDVQSPVLDAFRVMRTSLPSGSVLVFDETVDFIYPLWRPDYANIVHFVSTAQPFEGWLAAASRLKARYAFAKTGSATRSVSPLRQWIALHPEKFRLVMAVPNHGELYEIL